VRDEHDEWDDVGREEQALLRRCRKFVLSHPAAPGGGYKDILYLTPCGRWLRICSGAIYCSREDYADVECSLLGDTGYASRLFEE
jgi:hypothetical protein